MMQKNDLQKEKGHLIKKTDKTETFSLLLASKLSNENASFLRGESESLTKMKSVATFKDHEALFLMVSD